MGSDGWCRMAFPLLLFCVLNKRARTCRLCSDLDARWSFTPQSNTRNHIPGTTCTEVAVSWIGFRGRRVSHTRILPLLLRLHYLLPSHPQPLPSPPALLLLNHHRLLLLLNHLEPPPPPSPPRSSPPPSPPVTSCKSLLTATLRMPTRGWWRGGRQRKATQKLVVERERRRGDEHEGRRFAAHERVMNKDDCSRPTTGRQRARLRSRLCKLHSRCFIRFCMYIRSFTYTPSSLIHNSALGQHA